MAWYSLAIFLSSAGLMVLEIAAGRLLAPYIGVSLYSWTAIIGVVLAGIAVGLAAIWTLSSTGRLSDADDVGSGVVYGLLAGLGFGFLLIFLSLGGDDSGIWTLVPARIAGTISSYQYGSMRSTTSDRHSVAGASSGGIHAYRGSLRGCRGSVASSGGGGVS